MPVWVVVLVLFDVATIGAALAWLAVSDISSSPERVPCTAVATRGASEEASLAGTVPFAREAVDPVPRPSEVCRLGLGYGKCTAGGALAGAKIVAANDDISSYARSFLLSMGNDRAEEDGTLGTDWVISPIPKSDPQHVEDQSLGWFDARGRFTRPDAHGKASFPRGVWDDAGRFVESDPPVLDPALADPVTRPPACQLRILLHTGSVLLLPEDFEAAAVLGPKR